MLLEKFHQIIRERQDAVLTNKIFLLTVSGGIDSVVLCDLFSKVDASFVIAHCNFQLRGAESERDEQFVRSLAEKYKKEIVVRRFDTEKYVAENKVSIQEAARTLRYDWFQQLVNDKVADIITTAHHADDNIETVVMNFFRGTGLKGLTGMALDNRIYRPLLSFRKQEILEYATLNKLNHVEDSSNASNKYTRNFFRNQLLPAIKEFFPAVEENILHNIERLTEVEFIYDEAIKIYKHKLVEVKGSEEHIPILKLQKTAPLKTIIWELIKDKDFTAAQVNEVVKLMEAGNGSYITSAFYRIIKNRKWLVITPKQPVDETTLIIIDNKPGTQIFENAGLIFEEVKTVADYKISTSPNIAQLDAGKIIFPLILRKWKQGDYFYPLGMRKKKKLSKFFIDQKLSITDKEKIWVLEMDKKIVWVIGLRIDDRFKIEPSTKIILKITSKTGS